MNARFAHPLQALLPLLGLLAAGAGCSGSHASRGSGGELLPVIPPRSVADASPAKASGKIAHVVIIIQENRTVDDMFQGYPGADTVSSAINSLGQTVQLQPVSLKKRYDIDHDLTSFLLACDGTGSFPGTDCTNEGFDRETQLGGPPNGQFVYVPHKESKPYFDIANQFVLADNTFTSQLDESFVGHQYLIAAQAGKSVNLPGGAWGCDGGVDDQILTLTKQRWPGKSEQTCFDYQTLGDELDKAKLRWRFYASNYGGDPAAVWSAYQAVRHIRYSLDWQTDVITPQTQFFTDIAAGKLGAVTWITPTCVNSDHPNCGGGTGPSWVASLVNAVGQSQFWNSTAVFVVWDDWGGFYDHVPAPFADYDGLGFRVPMLVVSPYAKQNYVSHVQYESASILRFAEDQFGLARLADADKRAASPAKDCFDFSKPPRAFVPIQAPYSKAYFMHQPLDTRMPDEH
jgi:phospholipase C